MTTATVPLYSSVESVPTPSYDTHSSNFRALNQNYQVPINSTFGMGPGESFYHPSLNEVQASVFLSPLPFEHFNDPSHLYPPHYGVVPTFTTNRVTYNGGLPSTFQLYNAVPRFQTQPSLTTVLSPTSSSGSLTSLQTAWNPSFDSLCKNVKKANPESKKDGKRATRNATQSAKQELLIGKPKRKRGSNKRRPGTSFSELLDKLSHEVRKALEEEYRGCCDSINPRDISAKQKHWFTNRHCRNLPKEYQEAVPNFVCPAFLAFNSKCRAKAGRYDSTERHCQNCAGFQEISSGENEVFPVAITRSKYRDVQISRLALAKKKGIGEATKLTNESGHSKMLAGLFKDGLLEINHENESNASGAVVDHTARPSTTLGPTFESETVDERDLDTLPVTNHEGESDGSGAIVNHTAQFTDQPPTTSVPTFEPESIDGKWDFDKLLAVCNSNASGGIVDHRDTASPPATLEPAGVFVELGFDSGFLSD